MPLEVETADDWWAGVRQALYLRFEVAGCRGAAGEGDECAAGDKLDAGARAVGLAWRVRLPEHQLSTTRSRCACWFFALMPRGRHRRACLWYRQAGEATETRRVAYQICCSQGSTPSAGRRVNSNTPARLGITAGAKHTKHSPGHRATPGHREFLGTATGGGGGESGGAVRHGSKGKPPPSCATPGSPPQRLPEISAAAGPSAEALAGLQRLAELRATCIGSAPAGPVGPCFSVPFSHI